ncbi:hypothetical protein ACFQV2_23195 [Actinokineospora soli]|uniref:MDMPI C-terminal domain-containing protein n=1 Tax=Actinokineospora soli TaxID=1048753 RepID=A0ABW2TQ79_9PSEU
MWTFVGPRPASWWVRRRLHEVLVHRADALLALNTPIDDDPTRSADAIDEWLSLVADRNTPVLDEGHTLHLHTTDAPGEWTLRPEGNGVACDPTHAKATTALRGPAMDLLLVLLRRLPRTR